MTKVRCSKCGRIGYTASPYSVKCSECGCGHEIIKMDNEECKRDIENPGQYLESLLTGSVRLILQDKEDCKIKMEEKATTHIWRVNKKWLVEPSYLQ